MIKGELFNCTINKLYVVYFENFPEKRKINNEWKFLHDEEPLLMINQQNFILKSQNIEIAFIAFYLGHESSGFTSVGSIKTTLSIKEIIHSNQKSFKLSDFI